jgi:hypothetical protein
MKTVAKKVSFNIGALLLALLYIGLGVALVAVGFGVKGSPMKIPDNGSDADFMKWISDNQGKDEFVCINTQDVKNTNSLKDLVGATDKLTESVGVLKILGMVAGFLLILIGVLIAMGLAMKKRHKKRK